MTETVTIEVPNRLWEPTKQAFRALRTYLRDAGGTSRMTKKGTRVTLTVYGPERAVIDAVQNAKAIARKIQEQAHARRRSSDALFDRLEQERRARFDTFRDLLEAELRKRRGR